VTKSGDTDSWVLNTGLSKNPGFYPLEEKIETGSDDTIFPSHADGTLSASSAHPVAPDPPMIDPNPEGYGGDGPIYEIETFISLRWR
jgi:hypothetical protein